MNLFLYKKSDINISFPNPRIVHCCCYGSALKYFHVKVYHDWSHRSPHSFALGLLKELALEQEIGVEHTESEQLHDVVCQHGGSIRELCILFQLVPYYVNCSCHWYRCKQRRYIIGNDAFPFFLSGVFNLICKQFDVTYIVDSTTCQGF